MKNIFLKGLIFGIGFTSTILVFIVGYAAWTNILTKTDGTTINATIWNELVNNINTIGTKVDTLSNVPTGAIMAFDLINCPSGWIEYTLARGRFLRGIDPSGSNDTIRTKGDLQNDAFQGHIHGTVITAGGSKSRGVLRQNPAASDSNHSYNTGDPISDGLNGVPRTANETRPKNVAVLYCIKQ